MKRSLTLRKPCSGAQGEYRYGGLHLQEARGATLYREFVAAPEVHVPVLVDMRGGPRLLGSELLRRDRERDERRAGERGDHVRGAEAPRIGRNRGARRCEGAPRLLDVH